MYQYAYSDDEDEVPMPGLYGLPATREAFESLISVESPYSYEWVNGKIYNMTGSSPKHSVIAGNIESLLKEQIGKHGPCRVHRDQYVFIPDTPPVVPDVVLTCDAADWDEDKILKPYKIRSPLLVVEILSPSTQKYDRTAKFGRYKHCPTLEIYMLVNQDRQFIEVYRRSTRWKKESFSIGQTIKLEPLKLELAVDSVYEGIL